MTYDHRLQLKVREEFLRDSFGKNKTVIFDLEKDEIVSVKGQLDYSATCNGRLRFKQWI